MKTQPEKVYCTVCDHCVVKGVACDGRPEECPLKIGAISASKKQQSQQLRVRAVDCAQPEETDFVRSED